MKKTINIKSKKIKRNIKCGACCQLKNEVAKANGRYHNQQTKAQPQVKQRKSCVVVRRLAISLGAVVLALSFVVAKTPQPEKSLYVAKQIKTTVVINGLKEPKAFEKAEKKRKTAEMDELFDLAYSKLGCKYVHATAGPTTFDCQGYVHYIFTHCIGNVKCYVPRGGCTNQYNAIRKYQVSTNPKKAKKGDIVYFYGGGRWKHVGIALGDGRLIHATTIGKGKSCVKITKMPDWYT